MVLIAICYIYFFFLILCLTKLSGSVPIHSLRISRSSLRSRLGQKLYIVDPQLVADLAKTGSDPIITDFQNGFSNAFSARLVGAVVGNIVAVGLLKYLSDFVWSFFTGSKSEQNVQSSGSSDMREASFNDSIKQDNSVKKGDIPLEAWFQLALCIVIDMAGDASFAIPGVGEVEDAAWAPLSAYILSTLFGSNVIAGIDFAKEILPGTDIIPVAVLAWVLKYKYSDSGLTKLLGLSSEKSNNANQ